MLATPYQFSASHSEKHNQCVLVSTRTAVTNTSSVEMQKRMYARNTLGSINVVTSCSLGGGGAKLSVELVLVRIKLGNSVEGG